MDDVQFWKIIKKAKSNADGEIEEIAEEVQSQLTELPAAEIQAFDELFRTKMNAAYFWKLWGAAYLINGGSSDDGFEYFRAWLIAQGQKVYEAALADPDSLAKISDPDNDQHECEDLIYVAAEAYQEVEGKELPPLKKSVLPPKEPAGEEWDFDDEAEMSKRLPKLAKKHAP